jgi:hypothetical protein
MRKLKGIVAGAAVAATCLLAAGAADAGSAKFHSTGSSVNNDGALVVNWDQRGLGEGDVDYTLTADATALYACINGGGKNPSAANKQAFQGSVEGGGSFEAKNGRVVASLTAGPLQAPEFQCPPGQRRVLAAVSYTNIVLTDTTNGVSADVPDASRVFFDV